MFYAIIIFILSIFLLHSSETIAIFIAKSEPMNCYCYNICTPQIIALLQNILKYIAIILLETLGVVGTTVAEVIAPVP